MERRLKDVLVRVWVTKKDKLKLQAFADRNEKTASQIIREYIKRLPNYVTDDCS